MKYCLVHITSDNIKEIHGYGTLEEKKYRESNLQDIVNFTSNFTNEEELIIYLYYHNLINSLNGTIRIAYITKNAPLKILNDGLSFKKDIEYFNLDKLTTFYVNHLTDKNFMNEFINKFYYRLKNKNYFSYIIEKIKDNYDEYILSGILPLESNLYMSDFLKQYIIKKDKKGWQKDFTKLRELAMFAINYRHKNDIKNSKEQDIETASLINHYYYLIQNNNLTEEEMKAYEEAIKDLENNYDLLNLRKERKI